MNFESSCDLRPLTFSNNMLRAAVSRDHGTITLIDRVIAVNASASPATICGWRPQSLRPLASTQLRAVKIEAPANLLLLEHDRKIRPREILSDGKWIQYRDGDRPINLWRSTQDEIGEISLDVGPLLENRPTVVPSGDQYKRFSTRVNIWFASAGTDCLIHKAHPFIEIHTQIVGIGHMQKFRSQDPSSLYEDIALAPGATTERPFCILTSDEGPLYPWHQYYAETDCIWLAVEYHPTTEIETNA